jgi:NAD(P)-dependent dehydrogenase (short-subunit alcohol dehydrogenase family)
MRGVGACRRSLGQARRRVKAAAAIGVGHGSPVSAPACRKPVSGAKRSPMGRYGRVEEVSELIAFLASEKSSYITGQNIRIDGGITRSV